MISIEASAEIRRPVHDVFAFVADVANEPTWHTDVVNARLEPAGEPGLGKTFRGTFSAFGRKADGVADVTTFELDRRIVYRFRAPAFGVTPTLTYGFAPAADGTRFTRTVQGETSGVMRVLAPLMRGQMAKRNQGFVDKLKRRLEAAP